MHSIEKISDPVLLLLILEDNMWYTSYLIYTGPMILQLDKLNNLKTNEL